MNTPTKQPAPDYGEPWTKRESWFQSPYLDKSGEIVVDFEDRALSCINACAGMADPAAEIQAMRNQAAEMAANFETLAAAAAMVITAYDPRYFRAGAWCKAALEASDPKQTSLAAQALKIMTKN